MDSDLNTADVLLNRGLNGGYGYARGGYGNGHANFPGDGSAVKEAVRGNRDISLVESINSNARDATLSTQIQQGHAALSDRVSAGNQFLTDRIAAQGIDFKFQNVSDQLASAERLAFANQASVMALVNANKADTDRQLHALDIKQTECCCELKAGQATIIANQESARLASAEAENVSLRTQIMINNQGHQSGNG